MGRPKSMQNLFKPDVPVKKHNPAEAGMAGFDNIRENIDPQIKTQTVSTSQGTIEHVPSQDNHIANKKYVDAAIAAGSTSPGGSNKQVQYNDNGSFGGNSIFTVDVSAQEIFFDGTIIFQGDMNFGVSTKRILASGAEVIQPYDNHLTETGGNLSIDWADRFAYADDGSTVMIDWSTPATGIDVNTHKIINVVDPTANQDAATKKYVDDNSFSDFGTDNQIPYTNVGGNGFDYSAVWTFDGTDAKIKADNSKLYFGAGDDASIEFNGTDWNLYNEASNSDITIDINDGGTQRSAIVVNGDQGSVTMPRQSYVTATRSGDQTIANNTATTVIFNSEGDDNLGEYNTSTGYFTAHDDGLYVIHADIHWVSVISGKYYWTVLATSAGNISSQYERMPTGLTSFHQSVGGGIWLTAGQTIRVYVQHNRGSNQYLEGDGSTPNCKLTVVKVG